MTKIRCSKMKKGSHQKKVKFTSRLHTKRVHSSTSPVREADGSGILKNFKENTMSLDFSDVFEGGLLE